MSITKIDFDPDKKSIKDIFEGSIQMVIPRYQRTYSWPTDKVDEFYEDFIVESEKAEDNLAYLGTILFSKDSESNLEVIDGQQRLVTITIFFAAMRDLANNFIATERAKNFASGLQKLIIVESVFGSSFTDDNSEDAVKLKVGSDIEGLFTQLIYNPASKQTTIIPRKAAERNVVNAYNIFYNRVKKSIDHPKISSEAQLTLVIKHVQRILNVEYIDIRVTDKEVAFNLFESHNAKGVALAKTDLIKNYFFGRIKGSEAEKTKIMNEWDNLMDKLADTTSLMPPDRFFNYMIQSYDGYFSSSVLYRRIKPHIEDPSRFFKQLSVNINLMIQLKTAQTGDKVADQSLLGIERMKINQCFIFILSLQRNKEYINPKHYAGIIAAVEHFTYLYSAISKQPTNALERLYSKHALYLQEAANEFKNIKSTKEQFVQKERLGSTLLHKIKADFNQLLPRQSEFADKFAALSYENRLQKQLIRYTFEKIESHNSKGMVALGALFTLDHIVPQSKTNGVAVYNSIGNLVPLSASDNSIQGNRPPLSKLGVYKKNSNFYSMKEVIEVLEDQGVYGKDEIKNRTESLSEHVYQNVFRI